MAKKAWNNSNPLYRWQKRNKAKSRAKSSRTTGTQMARKRSFRRRAFSVGRKVYRSSRKSGTNSNLLITIGAAMAYGAGRAKLSQLTAQYLPSFAGQYTDEVVLGALGWYLSKKGGVIGALGKSALIIESASVGNQLIAPMVSGTTSANNSLYVSNL